MSKRKPIVFEGDALEVIRLVEDTFDNLFVTGNAGTGKSTLIRHIISTTRKPMLVVAPTGIAAVNIGGNTIHSALGIPIGMYLMFGAKRDYDFDVFVDADLRAKSGKLSRAKKAAAKKADLLIIDEVSMLRSDLLDAVSEMLKMLRNSKRPFGGMQVLLVGDMMQLPPVVCDYEWGAFRETYDSEFFFDAKCMSDIQIKKVELIKVHRQSDPDFIRILNNLRVMNLEQSDIEDLNQRVKDGNYTTDDGVYITTHNYKADQINDSMTAKIDAKPYVHVAAIDGYFNLNSVLALERLVLKKGMRVMTLINDQSGDFFNGKIGTVVGEPYGLVKVEFDDGITTSIPTHTWESISMEYDAVTGKMRRTVQGTFTQYPLKPAYAITVHKSQGLSFDKAILDINEVFAAGQAYTAVSRLRTLGGLTLMSRISRDVQIGMNDRLLAFIRG